MESRLLPNRSMRALSWILLSTGATCLLIYAFVTMWTMIQVSNLDAALDRQLQSQRPGLLPLDRFSEGTLLGRIEIPRLRLSVPIMEGVAERTLRLGSGHIPGTAYPGVSGNSGIAAHRDTFFRDLRKVGKGDFIRVTTIWGTFSYRVTSSVVVAPEETSVLNDSPGETITLVTCFPFYYVGPAPKRFVVHAVRERTPPQ